MKKVLVIGSSGMVASRFIDLAKEKFEIVGVDEKILDITDESAVNEYFTNGKYDVVINFAAYTNVDGAEKERGDESGFVWKLNVLGPQYLAKACRDNGIFLVHVSTDFVFSGDEDCPGPYDEDASPPESLSNKMGWYGWTKRMAEKVTLESSAKSAIVRYGYPFRADPYELKKDWARNLIKIYNEQKLYPLFTDQVQSVIFIDDLVSPIYKVIELELDGIFHIASSNTTTPYEIGKYLLEKYSGKQVDIQKGSMVEFLKAPGRTPRPRLGGLKTLKTQNSLNVKFRTWQEMIDDFVDQLKTAP